MFIIDIIALIIFVTFRHNKSSEMETKVHCTLNEKEYTYIIKHDEHNNIISTTGDEYISKNINIKKYSNSEKLIIDIEKYFINNDGTCK